MGMSMYECVQVCACVGHCPSFCWGLALSCAGPPRDASPAGVRRASLEPTRHHRALVTHSLGRAGGPAGCIRSTSQGNRAREAPPLPSSRAPEPGEETGSWLGAPHPTGGFPLRAVHPSGRVPGPRLHGEKGSRGRRETSERSGECSLSSESHPSLASCFHSGAPTPQTCWGPGLGHRSPGAPNQL